MRQLTSVDSLFLAVEDGKAHAHISTLGTYDATTADGRTLDAALVRERVTERMHLIPPLRWQLARVPFDLDYPYWIEDAACDPEQHVRELVLPSPGADRQLAEQVAEIIAQPLDRSRPLWEIYVIHGLADGDVALLTKLHHAAVDGVAGAQVVDALLDASPTSQPVDKVGDPTTSPFPSEWHMLGRGLSGALQYPLRALPAASRALPYLDEVPTMRSLPGIQLTARASRSVKRRLSEQVVPEDREGRVPRTRFQAPVTAQRRVAFGRLSLAEVKAVKSHFGCTVNDVVVALCTTALRSWLDDRGELPDEPLVAMVPVSVRTPEQANAYGNRASAVFAELPTDVLDPADRLRRVATTMSAAKSRHHLLPVSLPHDATDLMPPAALAYAGRMASRITAMPRFSPPVNVVITNVPGSPETRYFAGAEQHALIPITGALHGVGLTFAVFSYRDSLDFGVVADRDQLDDAWPLIDGLHVALDELSALVRESELAVSDA